MRLIGRFDFDKTRRRLMTVARANHVERGCLAENVLPNLKKIVLAVEFRNMPPEPISQLHDQRDERSRLFDTIILHVQQRTMFPDQIRSATNHIFLHAFDVDFDQQDGDVGETTVEGCHVNRFGVQSLFA